MNIITRLLSKSLRNRNPQLDLWGSDGRLLGIALQDLMSYLKVHWELTKQEADDIEVREKIRSYFYNKPKELEEFVNLWTGIWLKKWSERVKVILRSEKRSCKRTASLLGKAAPIWRRLKHRSKMKDVVIDSLIRNGEICGTSILAEEMLKIELGSRIERKTYTEEPECLLSIVNNVLRKVRKISRSKGPLIFIRIDKRFFRLLHEDVR